MSLEHIPSAILTVTVLLRTARLVRRRHLRVLTRTSLLTAGALLAASGHGITIGPVPSFASTRCHCTDHERKPDMNIASTPTVLAAADLVSGSHSLYTIGVGVLVVLILLAGGTRAAGAFFGGRIGSTVGWALTAVIVAVIVGSGYAIYVSTKHTVDRTGITTGQFGQ